MSNASLSPEAPIGVFDSGIGGLSVLRALRAELPGERFVYLADSGHAPYGERGDAHAETRARAITADLRARHGIKALVVACNTATTAAIHLLRAEFAYLPLVGVEPAVKPALALTHTGRVGVIGTRGTLASAKFGHLLDSLSARKDVVVQPCDGLASAIEEEASAPGPDTSQAVAALCARYLAAMGRFGDAAGEIDTLVLGCTHYVFAEAALRQALGTAVVRLIETGEPVARQTRRLLEQHGLLAAPGNPGAGEVELESTGDLALLRTAAARWLDLSPSVAA